MHLKRATVRPPSPSASASPRSPQGWTCRSPARRSPMRPERSVPGPGRRRPRRALAACGPGGSPPPSRATGAADIAAGRGARWSTVGRRLGGPGGHPDDHRRPGSGSLMIHDAAAGLAGGPQWRRAGPTAAGTDYHGGPGGRRRVADHRAPDLGGRGRDAGAGSITSRSTTTADWVQPIFNQDYNNWGFWFFGIWIPLLSRSRTVRVETESRARWCRLPPAAAAIRTR